MKKFLVLYEAPTSWQQQMSKATPEQAKAGMDLWMNWSKKNGKAIVDFGTPLGSGKQVQKSGASSKSSTQAAGFSILQAESMDALMTILTDHPHFQTPGGSIEVFEFMPTPGM